MRSAAPKIRTITAMRTRFASETVKIDQCRYRPGLFRLTDAINEELVLPIVEVLLAMSNGNGNGGIGLIYRFAPLSHESRRALTEHVGSEQPAR
jgi:hypothetical protein